MADRVVAVLGAGNVGCALAADLTLLGFEVRLVTRSEQRLEPIRAAGAITFTGAREGRAPVASLTTSVAEGVRGADVVAVTVPTPALPWLADELVANTTAGQLIWLDPGHSGGALYLAAAYARKHVSPQPPICQLSTTSHTARMQDATTVRLFGLPTAALAALPATRLDECFGRVDALLPGQFLRAAHVLELDLQNINALMHPAQMVCNAGWIEASGGNFEIYAAGTGPSVGRVIDAVDDERLSIARGYGVPPTTFAELAHAAGFSPLPHGNTYQVLQAAESIAAITAPPTLDHRYLHEDVAWGLVPWMGLAGGAGVRTATMAAITDMAGALNGVDYRSAGLTLARMGLAGRTPEQIVAYVQRG